MTGLCLLDHDEPTTATPGLHLCPGHLDALRDDLTTIDRLARLLGDMAIPGRGDGNARGRAVTAGPPAVLDALAATDPRTRPEPPAVDPASGRPIDHGDGLVSVVGVVTTWTRHLIDTRRLASRPATIHDAARLLVVHLDWCAAQPCVDEMAGDIHDAAHMLRRLAGENLPPVGRHHAPHPRRPDHNCGGRLYPLPWQFGVWCVDCGETYDGHAELRRLGLVLEG
jgi:hypothetical protein